MNNIVLENKKLHDWIVEKDKIVDEGRKNENVIQKIEKEIKVFEEKEKEITGKIQPKQELIEEGDRLAKSIEGTMKSLEKIGQKIEQDKLDAIPKDMKEKHQALLKEREEKERIRNKLALKVQKIKDRIVPLVQKEVKPILRIEKIVQIDIGAYQDIETARAKDGKVIINTFNHLEDWRNVFRSKTK